MGVGDRYSTVLQLYCTVCTACALLYSVLFKFITMIYIYTILLLDLSSCKLSSSSIAIVSLKIRHCSTV